MVTEKTCENTISVYKETFTDVDMKQKLLANKCAIFIWLDVIFTALARSQLPWGNKLIS